MISGTREIGENVIGQGQHQGVEARNTQVVFQAIRAVGMTKRLEQDTIEAPEETISIGRRDIDECWTRKSVLFAQRNQISGCCM